MFCLRNLFMDCIKTWLQRCHHDALKVSIYNWQLLNVCLMIYLEDDNKMKGVWLWKIPTLWTLSLPWTLMDVHRKKDLWGYRDNSSICSNTHTHKNLIFSFHIQIILLQGKLSITRSLGPWFFFLYQIFGYISIYILNNTKQNKLFHWTWETGCYIRYFVISDLL